MRYLTWLIQSSWYVAVCCRVLQYCNVSQCVISTLRRQWGPFCFEMFKKEIENSVYKYTHMYMCTFKYVLLCKYRSWQRRWRMALLAKSYKCCMCDETHSYMWHDSFIYATVLLRAGLHMRSSPCSLRTRYIRPLWEHVYLDSPHMGGGVDFSHSLTRSFSILKLRVEQFMTFLRVELFLTTVESIWCSSVSLFFSLSLSPPHTRTCASYLIGAIHANSSWILDYGRNYLLRLHLSLSLVLFLSFSLSLARTYESFLIGAIHVPW